MSGEERRALDTQIKAPSHLEQAPSSGRSAARDVVLRSHAIIFLFRCRSAIRECPSAASRRQSQSFVLRCMRIKSRMYFVI